MPEHDIKCGAPKLVVAQIGAREHYAIACALHSRGKLAATLTDFLGAAKTLAACSAWREEVA